MKRICLYLLILFIATYNTGVYEMAKLPAFFKHYAEHCNGERPVSLSRFIAMHYFGHDLNDNDDAKDAQLPFKNYHAPTHPNLLFVPVQHPVFSFVAFAEDIVVTPFRPKFLPQNTTAIQLRPPCC